MNRILVDLYVIFFYYQPHCNRNSEYRYQNSLRGLD
ncbi:hypothetical protein PBPMD00_26 [Pinkberry virus LS07-2018-MD00]|nr:hypothetical protein PBPMD00_26 [Pinkberry virus LS07-2018-MD00]